MPLFKRQTKMTATPRRTGSSIYEGTVRHRRNLPKIHQFDFRFFMLMLDLDELDSVFNGSWLWSCKRWALCRFKQEDHLKKYISAEEKPGPVSLKERAIQALQDNGFEQEVGAIRILTQVSYLGFSMNPVSFYYCFDVGGDDLVAIIAEVNNTPWGEQHLYVIPSTEIKPSSTIRSDDVKKAFHVSPFMSLDMHYRMAFSLPGEKLAVKIENHCLPDAADLSRSEVDKTRMPNSNIERSDLKIIDVSMALRKRPLTTANLNWLLVKYPAISFQVVLGIYWHALMLYLKKIRYFPHPHEGRKVEEVDQMA